MNLFRTTLIAIGLSIAAPAGLAMAVDPPYGAGATAIVGVLPNGTGGVTVTAGGFCPGSPIVVTLDGEVVGTGFAGATGSITFDVPANQLPSTPGVYIVLAISTGNTDVDCDRSDDAAFAVDAAALGPVPSKAAADTSADPIVGSEAPAPAAVGAANLPTTGSSSISTIRLALVAACTGCGMLVVAGGRRRSRRVT